MISRNFLEIKKKYLYKKSVDGPSGITLNSLTQYPIYANTQWSVELRLLSDMISDFMTDVAREESGFYWSEEYIRIPGKLLKPLYRFGLYRSSILSLTGPYISAAIIELIEEEYGDLYTCLDRIPAKINLYLHYFDKLCEIITGQDYWAFYMPNIYNYNRVRSIKIRHIKLRKISSSTTRRWAAVDLDSGEEFWIYEPLGWNLCLSKEDLDSRLKEIRDNWLKGNEERIGIIDKSIEDHKNTIKTLINEKNKLQNNLVNDSEKLNKLLNITNG